MKNFQSILSPLQTAVKIFSKIALSNYSENLSENLPQNLLFEEVNFTSVRIPYC